MKDYTAMFNRRSCMSFWQPVGGNLLLFQSLNNGNATHWTDSFPFKFCMASKHLSPSATHYKPFFLLLHPCITHSPESNIYHGKEYSTSWASAFFIGAVLISLFLRAQRMKQRGGCSVHLHCSHKNQVSWWRHECKAQNSSRTELVEEESRRKNITGIEKLKQPGSAQNCTEKVQL